MDTKAKKESGKLNIVDNDVDFWKIWESNPKVRKFYPAFAMYVCTSY